jgi:ribosomal protein L16/L10AE
MGKGKGALDCLMFYVKKGQILFEIRLLFNLKVFTTLDLAIKSLLVQCQNKIAVKTKILVSKK